MLTLCPAAGESKIAFTSLRWSGSAAAGGRNGSGVAAGEARNGFTFEAANNGGTTRNCDSYWSTKPWGSREKWELFPYRQKWRKHGALTAALRHLRRPKKGREARTKRGRSKSEPRGQQDSSRLSLCLPVPFYPGNVEMFRRFRTRPQFPHSLRRMPIRGLNIGCCETRYHSTLYE